MRDATSAWDSPSSRRSVRAGPTPSDGARPSRGSLGRQSGGGVRSRRDDYLIFDITWEGPSDRHSTDGDETEEHHEPRPPARRPRPPAAGLRPDRDRGGQPGRSGLRHLQPAAARADRLPGPGGGRSGGQPDHFADAVPRGAEQRAGHLPVHQLPGRRGLCRHGHLRRHAARRAGRIDDLRRHGHVRRRHDPLGRRGRESASPCPTPAS